MRSAASLLILSLFAMPVMDAVDRMRRTVEDPVPALGPEDEQALAKPDAKAFKDFIARYVDRIEAWHVANSQPPAALIPWLKAHPDLRHELWLAIDRRDDATAALAIIEELRARDEKTLLAHKHLAIAIAVVHDQPKHVRTSRMMYLWGVEDAQFGPTLTWQEIWDFYTDPKRQALFIFRPKDLAWPLMVHLVDLDVSREEIDWATREFAKGKLNIDLPAFYRMVPYDDDKRERKPTRLGNRPYTLENLRRYGGVCVDQGHFASRVAKIFGVPSMKCAGHGRYGGAGHAWSGFLAVDAKTRFPQLSFTGRYQYDNYYIGSAYAPQPGTRPMDRAIELFYAGVSGRYESYVATSALTRAAMKLRTEKPALAAVLLTEAVKTNVCVDDAWRTLLALGADRAIPAKECDQHWLMLTKALAVRHPSHAGAASRRTTLVYGTSDLCSLFLRQRTLAFPPGQDGRRIAGLLLDDRNAHGRLVYGYPVLGGFDQIETLVAQRRIGEVVCACPILETVTLDRLRALARDRKVQVTLWAIEEKKLDVPAGPPAAPEQTGKV